MLERVQRKWLRAEGWCGLCYEDRPNELKLFSFKERQLRNDLTPVLKIFNGKCSVRLWDSFVMDLSITRGQSLKLFLSRFKLEGRRSFFSDRVITACNRSKNDTVSSSSLDIFRRFLHRHLGNALFDYLH